VLKKASYYRYEGDKLSLTDTMIIRINERMGDDDAKIAIFYSKGDKISIGNVWIEDALGRVVRKLKDKEIKDTGYVPDGLLYGDLYVKYFELKHNTYPYTIHYSYKFTPSRSLGLIEINQTGNKQPIKNGKLVVNVPLGKEIRYVLKNVEEPLTYHSESSIQYVWNYEHKGDKKERNASYNTSGFPLIRIAPTTFRFGEEGSWKSWQAFGNWQYRLNKNKDVLPDFERARIDNLLNGITEDRQKMKILYNYLQDVTRYINVSVKLGGLQTYPAEYVAKNKYGDCKALTNFMKSMLDYVGIKSYYTTIALQDYVEDVDEGFPFHYSNHVILTVPMKNDTVFIECTSNNTALGYISTSIQGRKALIVDKDDSRLISVPGLKADDVLCSRLINIDPSESFNANVKLKTTERGANFEYWNAVLSQINKHTADKHIRYNIFSGSFDLLDFRSKKKKRESMEIRLEADLNMKNLFKKYGNNLVLTSLPVNLPLYENPDMRTQNIQIDYPMFQQDTIIYNIAGVSDKTISKVPENIDIDSKYGKYSVTFEGKGSQLIIYKSVLINTGRYPISEYRNFYDFITSIKNNENKNFYLEIS